MTTKHKPATALPIEINWRDMFDGEHQLTQRLARERAQLVAALQSVIEMYAPGKQQAVVVKALLRSLGEAE